MSLDLGEKLRVAQRIQYTSQVQTNANNGNLVPFIHKIKTHKIYHYFCYHYY